MNTIPCETCGAPVVLYSKQHIMHILMHRDNMTADEAVDLIAETQREINNDGDYDHETIQDIIQDNLGLEPDYMEAFIL